MIDYFYILLTAINVLIILKVDRKIDGSNLQKLYHIG